MVKKSQPTSIMTNVFTTSQFAQPQQAAPESFETASTGNEMVKKSSQGATTPLATSSPPIARRSHSYAYHNKGYSHDSVQSNKSQKYSAPAQLMSYPGNLATGSLLSSPSQQLHDYENMRYSTNQPISIQGQPTFYSHPPQASSSPPPIPMSRQKISEPPQPPTRPKRQRDTVQNDGSKSQSSNTKGAKSSRERKSGAPSKLSVVSTSKQEVDIPLHSLRTSTSQTPTQGDAVSLVSEVLDAEVTALTNSSSPGSSIGSGKHPRTPLRYYQGQNKKSKSSIASSAKEQQMLDQQHSYDAGANAAAAEQSTTSGSSGIASKNTSVSQNQSTASAGTSSTGEGSKPTNENILSDLQNRKKPSLARQSISPTPPKDGKGYDAPSYENWPPLAPRKPAPMVPPQGPILMPTTFDTYQHGIPLQSYLPQASSGVPGVHSPGTTLVPPLSIRQVHPQQYQLSAVMPTSTAPIIFSPESSSYNPNHPHPHYYFRASPGGGTEFVDVDSSLDGTSMPSTFQALSSQQQQAYQQGSSRPGSSHSAPMLDLSIDRHYEFDAARTPTDDLGHISDSPVAAQLPRNWNRPYLGYNPRVDRELGSAAELARRDQRVFSDSEISSPVFPRGRPSPAKGSGDSGSAAAEAVSARVEAMRKEFAEYQREQILSNTKNSDIKSSPTSKSSITSLPTESESVLSVQTGGNEVEISLRAPKLQRPPSSSPPPPPSNTSPFSGLGSSPIGIEKKTISGQGITKDNVPKSTSSTAGPETGTSVKIATEDDRLESLI